VYHIFIPFVLGYFMPLAYLLDIFKARGIFT
jgi:hypothetical protein